MRNVILKNLLFPIALALILLAPFAAQAKKPKTSATQSIQNKTCGYYLRYPKGSTLDRPGDCVLRITLPKAKEAWVNEQTLTLYTAPLDQKDLGEPPAGEVQPDGFLMIGRMKLTKSMAMDAAMSHRMVTIVYEGQYGKRKYRLEGFMNSAVPEVMDLHPKHWDPVKTAEKLFDGLVSTFRPFQ